MTDDKKIFSFPSKSPPECPVEVVDSRARGNYCHEHPRIRIDTHTRTVECADCGATLDPFDYIARGAAAIRRGWQQYEHVQSLLKEKREAYATLEKERKRLAGNVRRLRAKVGEDNGITDMRKPE